ncbi:MAG TPA: hypothetical protein VII49_05805 [Rhizomicrobium sp.]
MAYQPYWAARAHVLSMLNRREDASASYEHAIALETDKGVKDFLKRKMLAVLRPTTIQ